ncbi:MAG: carbohydrate kinase family protein [bacterium]
MKDIYAYGLVELSSIYTLNGLFPVADSYKEVDQLIELPGGEATNAVVVLSRLGLKTIIAGTWLGKDVYYKIQNYLKSEKVDTSALELKPNYSGPKDLVFVSTEGRTIFGWFGKLWFHGRKWSTPKEQHIKNCKVAVIDPFMLKESERAAQLCVKHNKPYVTIDEKPSLYIVQNSTAVVISNEFILREYPNANIAKLFASYTDKCKGLVVFTFGADHIIYGRKGKKPVTYKPIKIKAVDTLGAGDTFRAGIAYGLLKGFDDDKNIKFSSNFAAMICLAGPGVTKSPNLKQLNKYIKNI